MSWFVSVWDIVGGKFMVEGNFKPFFAYKGDVKGDRLQGHQFESHK